jgi:hypothetical protein
MFTGIAIVALVTVFILVKSLISLRNSADLKGQLVALNAQIESSQKSLAKLQKVKFTLPQSGMAAMATFQDEVTKCARENQVELREINTATDSVAYINRFAKDSGEHGWYQVDSKVSVCSDLSSLMRFLNSLNSQSSVFEIDSVEFNREGMNDATAKVALNINLRILTRGSAS